MASEGTSPLLGLDGALKPGAAQSSSSALPCSPSAPGPADQPPWEPSPQPPVSSAFSPGNPLVFSAFPNPLLMTGDGSGTGKVIVKVKTEGGAAEPCQTQNFILTPTALSWVPSRAPCAASEGPPLRHMAASDGKVALPTQAAGGSQEGSPGFPLQAPPPVAQLAPIVPLDKAWPGLQGTNGEGGSSLGELAHTSKGVYENFRRWQRYKALARRHLPQSPDVEALSCFLIPVLRSLARLKPTMTLEEGLPRAMQEWERTSNFDRMTFYEMAEKFMEFEAEEELQIQKAQMNGSQGQSPAVPLKLDPPGSLTPEVCQQPVYIPKKAASKTRAPRRRQRKPQRPLVPEVPKEIPPEAVKEYIDIMEGLVGSHSDSGESGRRLEEEGQQEEGVYPDASLLSYMDELCSQEVFVSKVEAVIHPQFLADLLSPEQQRDPLALMEELEQEEGLTIAQLVQKRLSALEKEDAQEPPSCNGAQSDSSPSVSDEDEDGDGRPWSSSGPQAAVGTVHLGKAAASGKQAREMPGGQEQAQSRPSGMRRDGKTPPPHGWEPQPGLTASQGTQPALSVAGRGSGEVINQLPPSQDGHLGEGKVLGDGQRADRTSEALPVCCQEGPQPTRVPSVDPGLTESVAVQGQGLEKQGLGLQTGQQMEVSGESPQGTVPLGISQEGSSGALWREGEPPTIQNYDQNPSPGVRDQERALSPGLWLSSEMNAVGLESPFQMEEVMESFQDGACVVVHPARESTDSFPLGHGEATALGKAGSAVVPSGGTDTVAAVGKINGYSLPEPLMDNSLESMPKEYREQSLETLQDPSDLWADSCSPQLGSADVSTLEPPKDALLSACHESLFIVGTPDAFLPQMPSQDSENRGNPFSPLLETVEHVSTLDVSDYCSLHLRASEDFNSYDFQVERREDSCLSRCDDLVLLQDHLESYIPRTLNSPSCHSLGGTSPGWESKEALALREGSISEAHNSLDGARRREEEEVEEEGEDEQLSNFAYLLASKLSLSPRGCPLSTHATSGGQVTQTASQLSTQARGSGQLPCPATKSEGQGLAGGSVPAVKRSQLGVQLGAHGEKPPALGVAQPSPSRKRRGDSHATGRRKKRRRSQV
ncbi:NUT family member 1 [Perognathus longimembris pacificus]|uniref:NUT family member 1 n=1 Tax=Perognathus longimembris pacificus TaxID=214514 RepID=UPI0020199394|nr:NUT family member 1 [Perognathus longimembris pacificus]